MSGILNTPKPGARCPTWPFTWCQVSEIPQNLVSGVPYALLLGARYLKLPEPGARGPIWPFTWGQVSDIPQNLMPEVLDTPKPHTRCPICTFTWCQVT